MAHATTYTSTVHETPHYLLFGRMPTLLIDIIMGMPQAELPDTASHLPRAYELARQNLDERSAVRESSNVTYVFNSFNLVIQSTSQCER